MTYICIPSHFTPLSNSNCKRWSCSFSGWWARDCRFGRCRLRYGRHCQTLRCCRWRHCCCCCFDNRCCNLCHSWCCRCCRCPIFVEEHGVRCWNNQCSIWSRCDCCTCHNGCCFCHCWCCTCRWCDLQSRGCFGRDCWWMRRLWRRVLLMPKFPSWNHIHIIKLPILKSCFLTLLLGKLWKQWMWHDVLEDLFDLSFRFFWQFLHESVLKL